MDLISSGWTLCKEGLPEVNEEVIVLTCNDNIAFDYINEPFNKSCPFQHFIVKAWQKKPDSLIYKIR